jgi:hypothetical protein
MKTLAIEGGKPVRTRPLPFRRLFGPAELAAVKQVFLDSWKNRQDFGYQGKFEERSAAAFFDVIVMLKQKQVCF